MQPQGYKDLLIAFEEYLIRHQPVGHPDSLYAPIRYINALGGKRIRPVLVLMAYNLWHDDVAPAMPAAMAVEFFHNFSLMHDDIMDEAPLRRGQDTVHRRYGVNAAILSGDAMLIDCYRLLLGAGVSDGIGDVLCRRMSDIALAICEGQQLDMDFERQAFPSEPDYLEMIRKKTAVLLGWSLELGGRMAGAPETAVRELYAIGETMGLGFQVQDDYLDVFGDSRLTGKQQGGDILQGKKNFPYVHHCATLAPGKREQFREVYIAAGRERVIDRVMQQFIGAGVDGYTRDTFNRLFNDGLDRLDAFDHGRTDGLRDIFFTLIERHS